MGCCFGRDQAPVSQHNASSSSSPSDFAMGSTKPLRKDIEYRSEQPWTQSELDRKRETFWETSPKYDGKLEIWQALKAICETEELPLAQAICDSVGIILPTGIMSDGCFDELGNRYVIPEYCFCNPRNLIKDNGVKDTLPVKTQDTNSSLDGDAITLLLRLSSMKDVKINASSSETIGDLSARLMQQESDLTGKRLKFFHLGKLLKEDAPLAQFKNDNNTVIQVFIK